MDFRMGLFGSAMVILLAGCVTSLPAERRTFVPTGQVNRTVVAGEKRWPVPEPREFDPIPPETEKKMMEFAMRESPELYKAVETLKAKIVVQEGKVFELEQALVLVGEKPETDADYRAFCVELVRIKNQLTEIKEQVKGSYLASLKFAAQPGAAESAAFERTATKDGVDAAAAVRQRYETLKEQK